MLSLPCFNENRTPVQGVKHIRGRNVPQTAGFYDGHLRKERPPSRRTRVPNCAVEAIILNDLTSAARCLTKTSTIWLEIADYNLLRAAGHAPVRLKARIVGISERYFSCLL